jgi:hypothetical protein
MSLPNRKKDGYTWELFFLIQKCLKYPKLWLICSVADTVGKAKQKRDTTGPNLNTQKMNEWKGQVSWLIVEKIEGETRFNCEICKNSSKACNLSTVWAYEGI